MFSEFAIIIIPSSISLILHVAALKEKFLV